MTLHFESVPQQPLVCFFVILLFPGFADVPTLPLSFDTFISWTTFALSAWFRSEAICFCIDYIWASYSLLNLYVYSCWLILFLLLFVIFSTIGFKVVMNYDRISPLFSPLAFWLNLFDAYLISWLTCYGLLS